jgi:DNA-binding Xre family transcriptional regulator
VRVGGFFFSSEAKSMSPVSMNPDERTRKNERAILHGLASRGQAAVAEALGVSESTVSRMKDGDIERLAKMLALCGLKIVPEEVHCYDAKFMESMLFLARRQLERMDNVEQLQWD